MRLRELLRGRRLLIVTAVEAERNAVLAGLDLGDTPTERAIASGARIVVHAGGVGSAAAAAATARALILAEMAGSPFSAVISAGVAGGFAGRAEIGATVLATASTAADLGAESPDGFQTLADLGLGISTLEADPSLLESLRAALPDAVVGEVLTVSTVTGTAEGATALLSRWPAGIAEAMEGFGVASAASRAGAPYAEIRTVSNVVGPRDRTAWRIREALAALTKAADAFRDVTSPVGR
jgi:futalosine hydrolase